MYNSIKKVLMSQIELHYMSIVRTLTKVTKEILGPHGGSRPSKSAQSGKYRGISYKPAVVMTWVVYDLQTFVYAYQTTRHCIPEGS